MQKHICTNHPNIYYRQHISNQVGANIGINQKLNRIKKLKNKTYQKEVFEILTSIEIPQKTKNGIKKLVIKNPLVFRRDKKEAIFLFIFALLNWI